MIGDNNHVQINLHGVRPPRPLVAPGESEVTNEQAAEIKRLIGKVVETSGRTYQNVYSILYRKFEATSYLMIKRHRYDDVIRYLHRWIGSSAAPQLTSGTSEDERKRLLKRIHAQARKAGGDMSNIRSYTSGRFGTPSLAELSPGQLREVIKQFNL